MKTRSTTPLLLLAAALAAPSCAPDPETDQSGDYFEGVAFDAENPGADIGGESADGQGYAVPTGLPRLVAPEIVVSLDGLTLHLFDRATGFSEVYPVGVGVLNGRGRSITPTGNFATGPDTNDGYYYTARRYQPSYFAGFPFIRLNIRNSAGQHTYGIHGPITDRLIRGYVSHGCVRMEGADVVRVFYLIRSHASTPVTIQREVERDAAGRAVDVGGRSTLGTSAGTDDGALPFVGTACTSHDDCMGFDGAFCATHDSGRLGFCSLACERFCPDRPGEAGTFCVASSELEGLGLPEGDLSRLPAGLCVPKAEPANDRCAELPGTSPTTLGRFNDPSSAAEVCAPRP